VKLELSTVVGVPLRMPAVDKESPAGSVPDVTDQLYGDVPPLAANVWLYAVPTVPEDKGLAVSITGGDGSSSPPHPMNAAKKTNIPAASHIRCDFPDRMDDASFLNNGRTWTFVPRIQDGYAEYFPDWVSILLPMLMFDAKVPSCSAGLKAVGFCINRMNDEEQIGGSISRSRPPSSLPPQPPPVPPLAALFSSIPGYGLVTASDPGNGSTQRHVVVKSEVDALTTAIVGFATRYGRCGFRQVTGLLRRGNR
jgi:hypothetical protein